MSVATTTPDPQQVVPSHLPSVLLGDEKNSAPVHKPTSALKRFRFWQPNAHLTTWVLAVDLDDPDALMSFFLAMSELDLPAPSWFIEKAENGHGQAAWVIEHVSHGENSRIAPQEYARDVRQALTNAFGGDQAFTNARCWNPWWSGWKTAGRVIWGPVQPRTLGELKAGLVAAGRWDPKPPAGVRQAVAGSHDPEGGRNCWVFDQARLRSGGSVEDAARIANESLAQPLAARELHGIIKSIEKYEAVHGRRTGGGAMSDEQIERQRALGALGGGQNTDAQRAARSRGPEAAAVIRSAEAVGRAAMIQSLHEQGLTRRQIIDKTGLSEATVKRALRAARTAAADTSIPTPADG